MCAYANNLVLRDYCGGEKLHIMGGLKYGILIVLVCAFTGCSSDTEIRVDVAEHQCTIACVGDEHTYNHGEEGHVCSPVCERIRSNKN